MTETVEISLNEQAVYIVKDGRLSRLLSPVDGKGEHIIKWENETIVSVTGVNEYTF